LNGEVSRNGVPYWKRKNKEGKEIKPITTNGGFKREKWDDGRPYHENFEIALDEISKFFYEYFDYLKYTEKVSSMFK
jgi:hypothetical protein